MENVGVHHSTITVTIPILQVTRVELLEGRAIIGSASGSILLLDMPTGRSVMSSSSTDHMDHITGIGASVHLQHCVTGSRDRNIKVSFRRPNH
jgi:syndecan 1